MEQGMVVLAIAGVAALLLVVWVIVSAVEKKRRQAMSERALEMGLQFSAQAPEFVDNPPPFKIFARGYGRKMRNLLAGRHSDLEVAIGDYQYTTGSGKNSHTHRQTICLVRAPGARLPQAFLRHEVRFFDAIGQKLGGQDIDFPEDLDFSKAFVLQGEDPEATRRLFDGAVRTHLARFAGTRLELEVRGDALVLHRGEQVKPEELRDLLQQAAETLGLLRRSEAHTGSSGANAWSRM